MSASTKLTPPGVQPGDLKVSRLVAIFAVLSVVFLGVLAVPPARSHFSEWRAVQQRYDAAAAGLGKEPVEPAIAQVWNPGLGIVDRCSSCHLGMGPAEALPGERLFAAHPAVPHDPAEFGCTLCHGGQGRATTREDAHGRVRHWDDPVLGRAHFQAGCGTCHSHLKVPSEEVQRRGEALFRRHDCVACHKLEGAGRAGGPDLSAAGIHGYDADWHETHVARAKAAAAPGAKDPLPWRESWGAVPPADLAVLDGYLATRCGAPKLLAAKALTHRLGCRGCHKINGIGGDDGPDLSAVGRKNEADLDWSGVRGPKTLANWITEHFLDPPRVVASSAMPDLGLSQSDAESLTLYMLSLRARDIPEAFWPKDKIRGLRLGEREFGTDGESLFGVFCAGCHGPKGVGRRYAGLGLVFPAIGHPDFLAVAGDDYLRQTITHGRSGRRMPAWGEKDGGLRPKEILAIVGYLRSLAPGTPVAPDFTLPAGDAARGAPLFARNCAACHGPRGQGAEAPAIAHPAFLAAADDTYIAGTILRGRAGTSMRHFGMPTAGFAVLDVAEIADIVAFLRQLGAGAGAAGN